MNEERKGQAVDPEWEPLTAPGVVRLKVPRMMVDGRPHPVPYVMIGGTKYPLDSRLGTFRRCWKEWGINLLGDGLDHFAKFLTDSQICFQVCCGFIGAWDEVEIEKIADLAEGQDVGNLIIGVKESLLDFTLGRGDTELAAAVEKMYQTQSDARKQMAKKIREADIGGMLSKEIERLDLLKDLEGSLGRHRELQSQTTPGA